VKVESLAGGGKKKKIKERKEERKKRKKKEEREQMYSRSRANFEGKSPIASRSSLTLEEDNDDYQDFYQGRHAFECVEWSCWGEIMEMGDIGEYNGGPVPDGILDDHAFENGFFLAPFQQVVDCSGKIRAYDLPPNITLRELSRRLCAAIALQQASDGFWKEDGSLKDNDKDAVDFAQLWVEEHYWRAPFSQLSFVDVYWQARPYIEGYQIDPGTALGGGIVYVDSWGS